jgi:hypothetical protein
LGFISLYYLTTPVYGLGTSASVLASVSILLFMSALLQSELAIAERLCRMHNAQLEAKGLLEAERGLPFSQQDELEMTMAPPAAAAMHYSLA